MELLKVQLGRAVWLFDTGELNPQGVALHHDFYITLGKRYQFATMPKPEDIYTGTSVYFKNGRFLYEATNVGVDFEFHNDGLVANTRHSTESADGFLTDVMNWLKEQLGLQYRADIVQKRIYRSELIVSINPKLDAIAEKLKRFSELVSNVTTKPSLVTGVLFGSQEIPAAFYIERRAASVPLERNHYIANAWMQTAQHLEMLNRFESIMAE